MLKWLSAIALVASLGMQGDARAERSEEVELLIISSASNRGEVDPCG